MKPQVSFIIINYNAGNLLSDSVKSVIDFPGVEVIVSDNYSQDSSFSDLSKNIKSSNLILIHNQTNLGFGKAVNQAIKRSRGTYIYLLNPDAKQSKTSLSRMIETSQKYQNRAIIAPRLQNPDGTPQPSCYQSQSIWNAVKEYWLGQKGAYGKFLPSGNDPQQVYAAVAAAWLVPRVIWDELGGLSDRFFLYFEDIELCDRAHKEGIPIIYDPQAIVKHAHGISSQTNPKVSQLFIQSAWEYHGWLKKLIIDGIIITRNLFTPPISYKKILGILLIMLPFLILVLTNN